MTQSANILLDVVINQTSTGDLNTVRNALSLKKVASLVDGSGLGQASKSWGDKRTLAGAAVDALDLAGVLTDAFGQSITFASVKAIIVAAAASNTDEVQIGGGSNAFASFLGDPTDQIVLRPGGLLVLVAPDAAGYAVTASTGDILRITNASASDQADYEIIIIGA